jgi:hypothetical protein
LRLEYPAWHLDKIQEGPSGMGVCSFSNNLNLTHLGPRSFPLFDELIKLKKGDVYQGAHQGRQLPT